MRFCLLATLFISFALLGAEEEKKEKSWSDTAELSYVQTDGNSESNTLGFKNKYIRKFDRSNFTFKVSGVRAESATINRFATGTPENFTVVEEKTKEKTAENYNVSLKYDQKIKETFYWFSGLDWMRNQFAGMENRYSASLGLGNVWINRERLKFKTDYGIQYNDEDPTIEGPDTDTSYGALRLFYELEAGIGKKSNFKQGLEFVANLEETDDFRVDCLNELTTVLTDRLALKVSLEALYDNDPSLEAVPIQGTNASILLPLDELDIIFTTSLVINF